MSESKASSDDACSRGVQLHQMDVFGSYAKFFAGNLNGSSGFV